MSYPIYFCKAWVKRERAELAQIRRDIIVEQEKKQRDEMRRIVPPTKIVSEIKDITL